MSTEVSSSGRCYGRKTPAPLPAHRMLERRAIVIPDAVDLRAFCGLVKDQGQEGSCTAHAGTSAAELIFRKYLGRSPIFSPQYTYAKELIAQGDFPQDDGSDGVTLCNSLIANGCCEESVYPYVEGEIRKPTAEQDANAAAYRMGAYHGVGGSEVALSVLGDPVPWPVEIGFTVYSSFESEHTAETGVMTVPNTSEQQLGGHEVLMVGFDKGVAPILRPANCPPAALILNSWGTSWGLGGFFWMPLEILDLPSTDCKIVHSGHKW